MKLLAAFAIQFALTFSYPLALSAQANQNQEKPAIEVPPAPPISGSGIERQSCPFLVDNAIPVNTTIEVKLGMVLESHRQKTGKKLWANSVYEMDLHECRMLVGAPVFGSVTAAASSKDPRHSELSLAFDAVDCVDHSKHPMKRRRTGRATTSESETRGRRAGGAAPAALAPSPLRSEAANAAEELLVLLVFIKVRFLSPPYSNC